jgi:hypothetical protein
LFGPWLGAVIAVVVAVLALGGGLVIRYAFVTSPDQKAEQDAPRITDTTFEAAATGVCKQYVQQFNTDTTLGQQPTQAQAGHFEEVIAGTFDAMVTKLSALPVAPSSRPAVEQWLTEWRQYDAFGHEYAAAISTGTERDLVEQDSSSEGALRRAKNGFAEANHMGSCSFD